VTGGGSGIGRETALALAEVGRPVAIWDVNAEGAEETAALCRDRYGSVVSWSVVDVSDTSAIEGAVPLVATALGSLGGFVHAAGVSGPMSVDFIDDELWDNTLNVNLRAAVMISRMLLEPFREAGPGSAAVLISSIEGLYGSAMLTAYCASKGGVLGVMRSIAQRFAMEGFRVNAVCPGAVSTPMLAPAWISPAAGGADSAPADLDPRRDRQAHQVPALGRGLVHHRHLPDRRWGTDRSDGHLSHLGRLSQIGPTTAPATLPLRPPAHVST
jgi:NAD(P)-dependent dehydrogenase (short-subunit alcohol dehydrogenase family)